MKRIDENTFNSLEAASDPARLYWETISRNRLYDTPIFNINSVHRRSRDGREADFIELDSPQWVNVVPYFIGTDGVPRFVMEQQFRHGSDSITLEFPAGLVERGESPRDAGLRELFEETGFRTRLVPGARAATEYRISSVARKQVVFFLGEVHGEPKLQAKKIRSCRWVKPGELGQYLLPQVADAAKALLARI